MGATMSRRRIASAKAKREEVVKKEDVKKVQEGKKPVPKKRK